MSLTEFVEWPGIEWYSERLKQHFKFEKREDGVLLATMHTNGEAPRWSLELHRAIGQMWRWVGSDDTVEVIIFTNEGNNWIAEFDRDSFLIEEEHPEFARYEYMYLDCRRLVTTMIFDVEVPTIGAIRGDGAHLEMGMLCDFTLMADNIKVRDPHFSLGMPPGDGIESMFFELLNVKQATWVMLMNELLTPQKCLEYGLVNEVLPREKVIPRAYEIADELMKQQRQVRRLATQIVRRPWKQRLVDTVDTNVGVEMFSDFCRSFSHANVNLGYQFQRPGADRPMVDEEQYKKVEAWAKSKERIKK